VTIIVIRRPRNHPSILLATRIIDRTTSYQIDVRTGFLNFVYTLVLTDLRKITAVRQTVTEGRENNAEPDGFQSWLPYGNIINFTPNRNYDPLLTFMKFCIRSSLEKDPAGQDFVKTFRRRPAQQMSEVYILPFFFASRSTTQQKRPILALYAFNDAFCGKKVPFGDLNLTKSQLWVELSLKTSISPVAKLPVKTLRIIIHFSNF
jgi:hypothetical protein